jgi:hypothetical protein
MVKGHGAIMGEQCIPLAHHKHWFDLKTLAARIKEVSDASE